MWASSGAPLSWVSRVEKVGREPPGRVTRPEAQAEDRSEYSFTKGGIGSMSVTSRRVVLLALTVVLGSQLLPAVVNSAAAAPTPAPGPSGTVTVPPPSA